MKRCYVCHKDVFDRHARIIGEIIEREINGGDTCVVDAHGLVHCSGDDDEFVRIDAYDCDAPVICKDCYKWAHDVWRRTHVRRNA